MIVVIQCAATKRFDAETLQTASGQKVQFVADPAKAPQIDGYIAARPDDSADYGRSWRETLVRYNEGGSNTCKLSKAFELYVNPIYRQFVDRFGVENTFILSAGWGLIRADFLTPDYDITFSSSVRRKAPHKFRHKADRYFDLCHLPKESSLPIYFFGGKDYVPLFCSLTADARNVRTIFYNSTTEPNAPGCTIERFETRAKTNWHYECARAFHRLHSP